MNDLQQVIEEAKLAIKDAVVACQPGEIVFDGSQYSPSDRALSGGHYVWENGTDEDWDTFSDALLSFTDALGCYWEDGCLWLIDLDSDS